MRRCGMNYFNYFTEVENEFVKRRGSHMLVSPLDWSLIESWKQRGIPLHVVLRGINTSFDSYDKRAARGRKINTLFFCQQEVEALYLEYIEARVGSDFWPGANGKTNGNGRETEAAPFGKQRLAEFLRERQSALEELSRACADDWPLAETFARAAMRLRQLLDETQTAARVDTEALEQDLTITEEFLLDGLKQSLGAEALTKLEKEAHKQLRSFREKMGKEIYEQTVGNYVARRLREQHQVPRLSLFYL
jgi:hypothetical protein